MEEDLQREIARNEAATRMAMEREAQALAARRRLAWIHTIEIVDKEHLEDYILYSTLA
jgi:hypothetical protein